MDYANLITALKQDNTAKVNKLIEALRPRMMAFLCIHMNASHDDAEDCVHDSLLIAIEVIKEDRLRDSGRVVSYILSICKNNYLKMQKKRREKPLDELSADPRQDPRQLQSLLDEEQKKLLKTCMRQLEEKYMAFMQYWFDHPDAHTNKVADHFNISVNNAWTRKHRLIKKLNECYERKSKL